MDPSAYKPQPVDTSKIELGEDLRAKLEALARNNHEVWSQARAAEGWKYGPERNDARKEHPGLVPYEQLTEAEKEIDRGTVVQTLKAAAALGFEIRRGVDATETEDISTERSKIPQDDICEWPPWPQKVSADAAEALDHTRDRIVNTYECADLAATFNLKWHRRIAIIVALFGTYAVVMAIIQLYSQATSQLHLQTIVELHPETISKLYPQTALKLHPETVLHFQPQEEGRLLSWAEFICAIIALVAVAVGVRGVFMQRWLLRRHRAERCRFLKFNFLLEVGLAARESEELLRIAQKFSERASAIGNVEDDDMDRWLGKEPVLQSPPLASEDQAVVNDMRVLADHYRLTRMEVQSRYFSKQAGRDLRWNWQSQKHVPMLFVASICFALAHFATHFKPDLHAASLYFTLLAACFPAIGAGVRALRGVSEWSRNNLRFTAKYNALDELIKELDRELAGNPKAQDIVLLLWKSEQILEGEHREWLRLMMETEWIG